MKNVILASLLTIASSSAMTITGLSGNILTFDNGSTATITSGSPTFDQTLFGTPSLLIQSGTAIVINFDSNVVGGTLSLLDVDTDTFSGDNAIIIGSGGSVETFGPVNPSIQNNLAYLSPLVASFTGNSVTIANSGPGVSAFGINTISTQVPEPSSAALLGLGALGLLARRKR